MFSTLTRSPPPHICLILSGKLECLILQRHAVVVEMFVLTSNVGVSKPLVQKHVLVQERCHHFWCKYMFFWWKSATCTKTWCKYILLVDGIVQLLQRPGASTHQCHHLPLHRLPPRWLCTSHTGPHHHYHRHIGPRRNHYPRICHHFSSIGRHLIIDLNFKLWC